MITLYSEKDPALDIEQSDYKAYVTDWDESHLKFIEGNEPIRFVCDEPNIEQRMQYMDSTGYTLFLRAFRNHVKRIENVGKRGGEPWTEKAIKAGRISMDWLAKSGLSDGEIVGIGAAIISRCVINRDELKNS